MIKGDLTVNGLYDSGTIFINVLFECARETNVLIKNEVQYTRHVNLSLYLLKHQCLPKPYCNIRQCPLIQLVNNVLQRRNSHHVRTKHE